MTKMLLREYTDFVMQRLEWAEERGDKEEWVRLANVLIGTLQEHIKKVKGVEE